MSAPAANHIGQQQVSQPAELSSVRRPQRLYLKVTVAMRVVDRILDNHQYTGIKEFLGNAEYKAFRHEVREIVRKDFDANIDSWPVRVMHNYVPDARNAILQAMEENWQLFAVTEGDEFVPSELIYERFYAGPL
ncbi:hypothetical protein PFICI_13837 [Pestalotiopsis fici W106-1]|uniref:Uncharacterized protein n=1 Tax=Pestalotiopsis fici (strain W106-1 / CGMCC3.15140) TaxID=1229662 RepID=W3WMD0_PESFW|nr:uncharacterized protein PFICI_13837 [Pestalotiopsis fici W106-1]ETS73971.1 hypothetical protein PFICI_13837 [Pestalotiopsis fici W106-1]